MSQKEELICRLRLILTRCIKKRDM